MTRQRNPIHSDLSDSVKFAQGLTGITQKYANRPELRATISLYTDDSNYIQYKNVWDLNLYCICILNSIIWLFFVSYLLGNQPRVNSEMNNWNYSAQNTLMVFYNVIYQVWNGWLVVIVGHLCECHAPRKKWLTAITWKFLHCIKVTIFIGNVFLITYTKQV